MNTDTKFYVLSNSNKTGFIKKDIDGKYITTSHEEMAELFTYDEAYTVKSKKLSKRQKNLFSITEKQISFDEKKYINKKHKKSEEKTIFDEEGFTWGELINTLEDKYNEHIEAIKFINQIINLRTSELQKNTELLSYYDKAITDLEHFLRLNTFDAIGTRKLGKLIGDYGEQRDKVKDNIKLLENLSLDSIGNGELKKLYEGLQNREYEPRVLNDLLLDYKYKKKNRTI